MPVRRINSVSVRIRSRPIAEGVCRVQDRFVFDRREIAGLGFRDPVGEVRRQPAGTFTEPEEPQHAPLLLGSRERLILPRASPLADRAHVEPGEKTDALVPAIRGESVRNGDAGRRLFGAGRRGRLGAWSLGAKQGQVSGLFEIAGLVRGQILRGGHVF